mmetsp:Transcript_37267/g.89620  ORF Transcript_37267/g.89620 Transcript_37267/m.89620 type:complete len:548 (-) Transcript_37267:67-1710(-)
MLLYGDVRGWRVVKIIFRWKGSCWPRCAFIACCSSATAALTLAMRDSDPPEYLWFVKYVEYTPKIRNPFSVQIYGWLLGFVLVFRTNMSLSRFWEGLTNVMFTHQKWCDAFTSITSFFNASLASLDEQEAKQLLILRRKICHWFTLMSALACLALNERELLGESQEDIMPDYLEVVIRDKFMIHSLQEHYAARRREAAQKGTDREGDRVIDAVEEHLDSKEPLPGLHKMITRAFTKKATAGWDKHPRTIAQAHRDSLTKYVVLDDISFGDDECELEILSHCRDKAQQVAQWITVALAYAQAKGWCRTAPPMYSRIFQEISTGTLCSKQALKIRFIPFPFPFVQMVAMLLVIFSFGLPFAMGAMPAEFDTPVTHSYKITVIVTFIVIFSYWGMYEIGADLSSPFSRQENAIPLVELHRDFCIALAELHTNGPTKSFLDLVDVTSLPEAAKRGEEKHRSAASMYRRSSGEVKTPPPRIPAQEPERRTVVKLSEPRNARPATTRSESGVAWLNGGRDVAWDGVRKLYTQIFDGSEKDGLTPADIPAPEAY